MRLLSIILIFNIATYANCYKVGNFKGVSAYKNDGYKISKDGISGRTFILHTGQNNASVSPSNIKCMALNNISLVCLSDSGTGADIETWLINGKKVQYTKSTTGNGQFDSVKLFIGDVIGKCK